MDFFKHKYSFLFVSSFLLCVSFLAANTLAQEDANILSSQPQEKISKEKIQKVIMEGTPDELKQLILKGFDVNGMYECVTPLNMAIKSLAYALGSARGFPPEYAKQKVEILLNAGADVNKEPCTPGTVPLVTAIQLPLGMYTIEESFNKGLDEEIKLDNSDKDCLGGIIPKPCKALSLEDKELIKKIVRESYDSARKKLVPYMMDIIEYLVANGANINAYNSGHKTPLHQAVLIPQTITLEPVAFLIKKGANVNASDINGNTPLFAAYASNNMPVVDLLINSGADTEIRNHTGALYNEVTGKIDRIYLDKKGLTKIDEGVDLRHGLNQ